MKLRSLRMVLVLVFCFSAISAFSLDREAFTFTSYDLNIRVEPQQKRLGVRGTITLRNDSQIPQKIAVLQISSSLDWRSIKAGGTLLQFVSQPYNSDIDHTGMLSEAIVTLPEAVAPKSTVDLDIAYEGVIVLDAARLTRIGTPDDAADSSDWDQISAKFTAVRGAGYVAWYPIATEAADLSEATNLFDVLGRWKAREEASKMHVQIDVQMDESEAPPQLLVNNASCRKLYEAMGHPQVVGADCTYQPLGFVVPTFVMANYQVIDRAAVEVYYLSARSVAATSYADSAEKLIPFITEWFGAPRNKVQTADLIDANAAPFEGGSLLLMPLTGADPKLTGLAAVHQLSHSAFSSARPWINDGLSHFAQALYIEQQDGRQSALNYMAQHWSAFAGEKPTTAPRSDDEMNRSLMNTTDENLYRSKAMYVWWMLRDMVGDQALKKALASYRPEQDKEPSYLPRLIQAQTPKDLEWFFDDWVYRDRGLPDFKIESAFPRKTMTDAYLVTVTVGNAGTAGAEVPLTVKFAGGEVTQRIAVRGKSNAVIRVEVPKPPQEIVVNDGSVPESDMKNNTFKIQGDAKK